MRVYVYYNIILVIIIMERNQVISVAAGVGAIGTILAYLAYSHINKIENNELIDNLVAKSENKVNQEKNIKLKIKKNSSCWGQFWKNEYNKQQNNNIEDDNENNTDNNENNTDNNKKNE